MTIEEFKDRLGPALRAGVPPVIQRVWGVDIEKIIERVRSAKTWGEIREVCPYRYLPPAAERN